jgi:hypothetical protein
MKDTHFFRPQGPGFAVALLASVAVGGTIGYHLIERWSVWRSFYVTALAVTTLGVPDMSRRGEVFTLVVILAGVGAALYSFTLLATLVVEGGLPSGSSGAGMLECSIPSQIISSSADTAALADSSRRSSRANRFRSSSSNVIQAG